MKPVHKCFLRLYAIQLRDNGFGIQCIPVSIVPSGQRNLRLNLQRIRPRHSIVQAKIINGFLHQMAVEAAFSGIDSPKEIIGLRAVQPKGKADLKNRVPLYR